MKFEIRGFARATGKELSIPRAKQEDYRLAQEYVHALIQQHPDVRFELVIMFE